MTRRTTTTKADQSGKVAYRSAAAIALFVAVAAFGTAADLWSKHAVFDSLLSAPEAVDRARGVATRLGTDDPREVLKAMDLRRDVGGGLRLTLSTNPGVVFGLPMPPLVVAGATVMTMVMVSWFFAVSAAGARWTHVALALILAGALGNFYDRMFARVTVPGMAEPITGQVRDFLDFSQIRLGSLNYPYIFNVADVWLVVGVVMLMLYWLFAAKPGKKQAPKS